MGSSLPSEKRMIGRMSNTMTRRCTAAGACSTYMAESSGEDAASSRLRDDEHMTAVHVHVHVAMGAATMAAVMIVVSQATCAVETGTCDVCPTAAASASSDAMGTAEAGTSCLWSKSAAAVRCLLASLRRSGMLHRRKHLEAAREVQIISAIG